jgi:hypothetical protein
VQRSKNEWIYASTTRYAFTAWCLIKHRDNFTFTFKKGNTFTDIAITKIIIIILVMMMAIMGH